MGKPINDLLGKFKTDNEIEGKLGRTSHLLNQVRSAPDSIEVLRIFVKYNRVDGQW
jgi:hypothetical protein